MNSRAKMLMALGVLAFGSGQADAKTGEYSEASIQRCIQTTGQSEVECACGSALNDGSAAALASFLSDYADSVKETACAALAQTLNPPTRGNGGDSGDRGFGRIQTNGGILSSNDTYGG